MSQRAPGAIERSYAEWYVWAKRNLSPSIENCHAAARAATFAQTNSQDPMAAARQSAASRSGPGWESPADPWTRGYAEWFDWARLNLGVDGEANHAAGAAAINALQAGADPGSAMDAARAAVASAPPVAFGPPTAPPPAYPPGPPLPAPPPPQYPAPAPYGSPTPQQPQYPAPVTAAPPPPQYPPAGYASPPGPQGYAPQPYAQPGFAPQGYAPLPYPQPAGAGLAGYPATSDASGMKRSPLRVAILLTLGNVFYYVWWMWEVMGFGIKERFPRARSFWWTLIPIYGYVVIYRVLEDQALAEAQATGTRTLKPATILVLLFATGIVNRATNQITTGVWAVVTFLFGFAIIGTAGYLTQRSTNRYLEARYPGVPMRGMSPGEIVATILGLLLLALVIVGSFSR